MNDRLGASPGLGPGPGELAPNTLKNARSPIRFSLCKPFTFTSVRTETGKESRMRKLLGPELRALRRARGISQTELGQAIGTSGVFICLMETGACPVPASRATELRRARRAPGRRRQDAVAA
jgi:DNA-binding XRE family transcriptional regulator